MGTVADFYPSNYLSAADLKGAERIVTIDRVETNTFENDGIKKTKPVIHFKDNGIKPIVCNKTNFLMIAAICGADSKDWGGKQICLFPDLVSFKGKVSEAIRAKRPPMAPQAAVAPAPTPAPTPERELVVEPRANYDLTTTKPVVAAAAARGSMDDDIPF
jgi:hypothetical protein